MNATREDRMNDVNQKQRDEKKARAKRADVDLLNARMKEIAFIAGADLDTEKRLEIMAQIAEGKSLDDVIRDAGRAALGIVS